MLKKKKVFSFAVITFNKFVNSALSSYKNVIFFKKLFIWQHQVLVVACRAPQGGAHFLSTCGLHAPEHLASVSLRHAGLAAPQHVGS